MDIFVVVVVINPNDFCVARYQLDFDGMSSKILAQRYYYQALTLCPEDGMFPNFSLAIMAFVVLNLLLP